MMKVGREVAGERWSFSDSIMLRAAGDASEDSTSQQDGRWVQEGKLTYMVQAPQI